VNSKDCPEAGWFLKRQLIAQSMKHVQLIVTEVVGYRNGPPPGARSSFGLPYGVPVGGQVLVGLGVLSDLRGVQEILFARAGGG
jgi:hypothetical protein